MKWLRCWLGIVVIVAGLGAASSTHAVESRDLRIGARLTLFCQGQPGLQGTLTGQIGGESVGVIQPCIVPEQALSSTVVLMATPEPHLAPWVLTVMVTGSDGRTNSCTFAGRGLLALRECPAVGNPNDRVLVALTPALILPR